MTDVAFNILPFYAVVNLLRWLPYDNWRWLLLRIFAAALSRIFYGECLTTTDTGFCCESFTVNALRQLTLAFAANLCGSSVANLLRWMHYDNCHWLLLRIFAAVLSRVFYGECITTTDTGFCCESLRQFCRESFTVNALRQLTLAFAANLCGSSVANLLRWMPYDNWHWLLLRIFAAVLSRIFYGECLTTTDNGFCCESLRQFCRESFTVNALRQLTLAFAANLCGSSVASLLRWMHYDNWHWLLLRIFAAVLSRIFYGECLTTTDNGFCCESLRQFCRESFTVNALRQLTLAFAANLCGSSVANLLRWMPYDNWQWLLLRIFAAVLSRVFYGECITTTDTGFCCESLRQFCRESFTVNALDNWQWLLLRIFAAVLSWIFCGECLTTTDNGFCCETLRQFCRESFTVNVLRQLTLAFAANLCGSSVMNLLRWMPYDNWQWLLLRIFAAVLSRIFYGECLTTTDNGFCCESLRQFCRESFTVNALRQLTMAFAANLCDSSVANLLRWMSYDNWHWLLLRIFAAVLSWIFYGECLTTTDNGFCCESLRQFCRESFTVNALRQLTMAFAANLCGSSVANLLRWMSYDNWHWLLLRIFAAVLSQIFYGDCLTTTDDGFCFETLRLSTDVRCRVCFELVKVALN